MGAFSFCFFFGRLSSSVTLVVESDIWGEDAESASVLSASRNLETPVKLVRLLPFAMTWVAGKRGRGLIGAGTRPRKRGTPLRSLTPWLPPLDPYRLKTSPSRVYKLFRIVVASTTVTGGCHRSERALRVWTAQTPKVTGLHMYRRVKARRQRSEEESQS